MPRIRTLNSRKPPEGWEEIEPFLEEINKKMRDAEREPHDGKRKCEALWPIFRLNHQRSRYVFEMYYKKKAITRELYDYCLQEGWADQGLISKWRKEGYERLCCLECIQTANTSFSTTCICRVPRRDLEENKMIECVHCGCRGCASGDVDGEL
eukprot:GHVN01011932.1.p1 GENE.GHVN01011932.1~~GHVN01011932.1.p1  ORF type:complete len:166 (+),score=21.86 GHVN01011932.1:40-498(+)